MLAGDESVVEPWLLGWCWVVVRAGGGADSMPYCSVGERGSGADPDLPSSLDNERQNASR
jgi:hypothetical protein